MLGAMNEHGQEPVRIDVGFDFEYLSACETFGGGWEFTQQWRGLGDLLAHRPGWHFDIVNDGEAMWSAGAFGASRMNITLNPDGSYHCYDRDEDSEDDFGELAEVEAWLMPREERARSLTDLQREITQSNNWSVLLAMPYEIRISWSDGWYTASVSRLPEEAAFQDTLGGVVHAARELITAYFGAPSSLSEELKVRLVIDESAAATIKP